jgi:hypothetical protein
MFWHAMEKLLKIWKHFTENLFKSKLKFIGEFEHALGIIASSWWIEFNEGDLEKNYMSCVRNVVGSSYFIWTH